MASVDGSPSTLIGRTGRSVTTISDEVARVEQALFDLAHAQSSSVTLTHCSSHLQESDLVRELGRAARERGFISAQVTLSEEPLHSIDRLVCAVLDALHEPKERRAGGILGLLASFYSRHGKRAEQRFDEGAEEALAAGDLTSLCRAYLAATDDASREVDALTDWAEGVELPRRKHIPGVRGTLNVHTGQRVLSELSRVVQALGYPGLFIVLGGGDSIAEHSPRQRERSYTLLRELVDNFDSGAGMIATRITITGRDALFTGVHSLAELPPLWARLELVSQAEPPPPHRSWTSLIREPEEYIHRKVRAPDGARPAVLRSLIRLSQGLPPVDAVAALSVGHERVDKTIDRLFQHAEMSGSVFQVLSGEYGSGKTHILLHLAERAVSAGHPVFWLNLERMNLDLGNPARHLSRVLARSVLPGRRRASALHALSSWTRTPRKFAQLQKALDTIAQSDAEESKTAKNALSLIGDSAEPGDDLERFLAAEDLSEKPGGQTYRRDAYRRLLLWVELLRLLEGAKGPVILIDEAENLYTTGVIESQRRSALRTLSFYCGGAIPGACVVMAMTPPALAAMRKEAGSLLREAASVHSTLELEDVDLFRRRLHVLQADEVPAFSRAMRHELSSKVRAMHKSVRGPVEIPEWEQTVSEVVKFGGPPRLLMRRLVDELEAAWWAGS